MNWNVVRKPLVICLLMLSAAALAVAAKPTTRLADLAEVNLEEMIPEAFGDWQIDRSIAPVMISPDAQAVLDKIYNQILSRTYQDAAGRRVMLSVAYGGNQSDSMQVHRPEVCYPAQGFQVIKQAFDVLNSPFGSIPVKRLVATQGRRVEPITYWITIGDSVAVNTLHWKLNQLRYGLTGKVPDGLLFRVSTITSNDADGYRVQDDFVKALLSVLPPGDRARLIGNPIS